MKRWQLFLALAVIVLTEPARAVMSDAEFFSLLDYSRPELASVQKFASHSDWPGATRALAQYMRQRKMPHWNIDPPEDNKGRRIDIKMADMAMAHRFNSLGIEWKFGKEIDWKFNPTTQPGSKWPRNHEWVWGFNRHTQWIPLANAYYETGDEKYAREIALELRSWVSACPVPTDKADNAPFSNWRTIEAGIRAGTVWPQVFPRIWHTQSFDDGTLVLLLKSYADHAHYLMAFHTHGNWLTMEANGLYHCGALFPEFKDAKLWRDTAAERLDHELDFQVYPDGAQIELTPGYHCVALNNFLGPVQLIPTTGFQPPADYLPKIEKMFNYLLYSEEPTGTAPPLNDSGAVNIGPVMKEAALLFPSRADFRWAGSDGEEGEAPSETSHCFPYAGQFVMRSGWGGDARWLCMDGGPYGFGHQHEDKLSIILTAYGHPLLVEGGTYTYDASGWRAYVLSSRAHNVVLVDGLEQDRRHEPPSTWVVKEPLPQVWESNGTFDHAAARYDEGFGPDSEHPISQTRHVFFLKPEVFVVVDELKSLDGKPHQCEALFHLDAPGVNVSGLRVGTKNARANLSIEAFGADGVKIVKGQKEPVIQGWLPDSTLGYGGIRPIPTAVYHKTVTGQAAVIYVLYPSDGPVAWPVTGAAVSGDTLTVHFAQGPARAIQFQPFSEK